MIEDMILDVIIIISVGVNVVCIDGVVFILCVYCILIKVDDEIQVIISVCKTFVASIILLLLL